MRMRGRGVKGDGTQLVERTEKRYYLYKRAKYCPKTVEYFVVAKKDFLLLSGSPPKSEFATSRPLSKIHHFHQTHTPWPHRHYSKEERTMHSYFRSS